jgi:hypothetical protein
LYKSANLRGFFPKADDRPDIFISNVCLHFADLQAEADSAWRQFAAARQAKRFVAQRSASQLQIILRYLDFDTAKEIVPDMPSAKTTVYNTVSEVREFLLQDLQSERYRALLEAAENQLKALS